MNSKKEKKEPKKIYSKPVLRIVNIAPGIQTLGVGCKLPDGSGISAYNPCVSHVCGLNPGS